MKIIIFIRHFNDFDNVLPIIDYLVRVKRHKDVEIYGARGRDYLKCNKHLTYVSNVLGLKVLSFMDTHISKRDIVLLSIANRLKKRTDHANKLVKLLIDIVAINIIRFINLLVGRSSINKFILSLPEKSIILVDFGTEAGFPYKYLIKYRHKRSVSILAYLHGYSIFSNVDSFRSKALIISSKYNKVIQKILFGRFSNDYYDKYLVGQQQSSTYFSSLNFDWFSEHSRIVEIGLPRYTKEWINRFLRENDTCIGVPALRNSMINKFQKYDRGNSINVALFTSHARFNVDEEKLNKTIEMLSLCDNINLVIKAHTRGEVPKFSKCICNYDSSEIIEWADIGIVYGTSMSMQMLVEDVVVVVPSYVDSNTTILENNKVCVNAYSLEFLRNFLLNYPNVKSLPNKKNIDLFIKKFVYGDCDTYDELMNKFCYFLNE
jgi:hypothetical protein